MSDSENRAAIVDAEHLRLLEIFYYIAGGSKAVFALFPLLYVVFGIFVSFMATSSPHRAGEPSPAIIGLFIAGFGFLFSAIIGALAAAQIYVGRCIRHRRHRGRCYVIAAIGCINIPWGTAMAVFTFMVLGRDSVKALFNNGEHGNDPQVT